MTQSATSPDAFHPPIDDGTGYHVRRRDLAFLGLSADDVGAWQAQSIPLGMSAIQYAGFCEQLAEALVRDGIAPTADIRLKGSAAEFFSGYHKPMPCSRDELIDLFRDVRDRLPSGWEIDEIERRRDQWIADGVFPSRRPFDSMFRLTVDREPSDYDLQISSDEAVSRCIKCLEALGQDPTDLRVKHRAYNFIRKHLVEEALPYLYRFTLRTSDQLGGRHVSVALFDASGPPDTTATDGPLSAHHRDNDWRVRLRGTIARAAADDGMR